MKNLFKKIKTEWNTINPQKHWMVLLQLSFIVIICMIIGSIYFLYQIKNEQIPIMKSSSLIKHDVIEGPLWNDMIESFYQKENTSNKLQSHPIFYKDPSL